MKFAKETFKTWIMANCENDKALFDRLFSILNALIPIFVVVFLLFTHGNYVKYNEYEEMKQQIFNRLDNIESMILNIKETQATVKNSTYE